MQSSGAVAVVPVNMCSRVGVSISYLDRPAEAGCRGEPAVNGYPPTRQTAEAHKTQHATGHSGNMMGGETLILPLHARPMYPLSAQADRWGRWSGSSDTRASAADRDDDELVTGETRSPSVANQSEAAPVLVSTLVSRISFDDSFINFIPGWSCMLFGPGTPPKGQSPFSSSMPHARGGKFARNDGRCVERARAR
jgi:hypothetical protein